MVKHSKIEEWYNEGTERHHSSIIRLSNIRELIFKLQQESTNLTPITTTGRSSWTFWQRSVCKRTLVRIAGRSALKDDTLASVCCEPSIFMPYLFCVGESHGSTVGSSQSRYQRYVCGAKFRMFHRIIEKRVLDQFDSSYMQHISYVLCPQIFPKFPFWVEMRTQTCDRRYALISRVSPCASVCITLVRFASRHMLNNSIMPKEHCLFFLFV